MLAQYFQRDISGVVWCGNILTNVDNHFGILSARLIQGIAFKREPLNEAIRGWCNVSVVLKTLCLTGCVNFSTVQC